MPPPAAMLTASSAITVSANDYYDLFGTDFTDDFLETDIDTKYNVINADYQLTKIFNPLSGSKNIDGLLEAVTVVQAIHSAD